MARIINLTQHAATSDQVSAGVFEPADKSAVAALLTFEEPPTKEERAVRAATLAEMAVASEAEAAMIGGAPFFMYALEAALKDRGVRPVHAFSRRESVEKKLPDGSVQKTQVFRHAGWVEA